MSTFVAANGSALRARQFPRSARRDPATSDELQGARPRRASRAPPASERAPEYDCWIALLWRELSARTEKSCGFEHDAAFGRGKIPGAGRSSTRRSRVKGRPASTGIGKGQDNVIEIGEPDRRSARRIGRNVGAGKQRDRDATSTPSPLEAHGFASGFHGIGGPELQRARPQPLPGAGNSLGFDLSRNASRIVLRPAVRQAPRPGREEDRNRDPRNAGNFSGTTLAPSARCRISRTGGAESACASAVRIHDCHAWPSRIQLRRIEGRACHGTCSAIGPDHPHRPLHSSCRPARGISLRSSGGGPLGSRRQADACAGRTVSAGPSAGACASRRYRPWLECPNLYDAFVPSGAPDRVEKPHG